MEGGHSNCNASLSQPNVQKNGRALVIIKSTPKKKEKIGHMFPCIMYFFIHPQPNNIGPAQQQLRYWGSLFNFSESGRGGVLYL